MFSTTNVSDKWNVRGFERMLSYEKYPEEKSRLWLSSFKKKLINLYGGQLYVTTNIYLKSCAYHPDSEYCTFFHGNLSNPKSSEDTLLHLYVIWNMLKSADLHETILTPHRSVVINSRNNGMERVPIFNNSLVIVGEFAHIFPHFLLHKCHLQLFLWKWTQRTNID